jgi:hypothetical protein
MKDKVKSTKIKFYKIKKIQIKKKNKQINSKLMKKNNTNYQTTITAT